MSAMFITRNALFFRFPKSLPEAPSLFLRSSHKPSRLVLVNSSNYSDFKNWHGSTNANREEGNKGHDGSERAKETMREGMDEAKDRAHEMKERAKDYAHDTKEDTKDAAGTVADQAKEGANRAAEMAYGAKEKTEDAAAWTTEKTAETVKNVGDKAKETVQGAWGAAKDTAQKIKENVVGKDDDNDKDGTGVNMDDDVIELRKRAGKVYDDKRKSY